jgi:hypothetical protein
VYARPRVAACTSVCDFDLHGRAARVSTAAPTLNVIVNWEKAASVKER